ncbi:MAG: hypothetical protein ACREEP_05685 [Dongiaceae bacterium]
MREIPRAILLPPPSPPPQRSSACAVQSDSELGLDATRGTRRQPPGPAHSFLTLIETRREDTVEIKSKQFRFRPYGGRGATADNSARETELDGQTSEAGTVDGDASDTDIAIDILNGFGAGARERNSSAFLASFIAQERMRQGLFNPQYEAASDAYRRAGGSPSAADNQPRVVSFAI